MACSRAPLDLIAKNAVPTELPTTNAKCFWANAQNRRCLSALIFIYFNQRSFEQLPLHLLHRHQGCLVVHTICFQKVFWHPAEHVIWRQTIKASFDLAATLPMAAS